MRLSRKISELGRGEITRASASHRHATSFMVRKGVHASKLWCVGGNYTIQPSSSYPQILEDGDIGTLTDALSFYA